MTIIATLQAISITAPEQTTVAGAPPYEDAVGRLSSILQDLIKLKTDLTVLSANLPAAVSVTFTNGQSAIAGTNSFIAGQGVQFTGTLPTGFATATTYYVLPGVTSSSFQVAATVNGSAISASSAGTAPWTAVGANKVNISAVAAALA